MRQIVQLAVLCCLVFALPSQALAADTLALRAERNAEGFGAQQALVFEKEKVLASRNSNFLCRAEKVVTLGSFEAPLDKHWKSVRARIEQIRVRLARRDEGILPSLEKPASPHDVRAYIGAHEITGEGARSRGIERIVAQGCTTKSWKPVRAVSVEAVSRAGERFLRITHLGAKAGEAPLEVSFGAAACRERPSGEKKDQPSTWDCRVPDWGLVTLII